VDTSTVVDGNDSSRVVGVDCGATVTGGSDEVVEGSGGVVGGVVVVVVSTLVEG